MDITRGPFVPSADAAAGTGMPPVSLRFRPTILDFVRISSTITRHSPTSMAMGAFILGAGTISFAKGDVPSLALALLGASMVSGTFSAPFVWFGIRRRRELFVVDTAVTADAHGIETTIPLASAKREWAVFRRSRETSDAFLLDPGTGGTVFVLKRGSTREDIDSFRRLLVSVALPPVAHRRIAPIAGAVVGFLVAIALMLGPRWLSSQTANASADLSVRVEGGRATVDGTTNLPDGSFVDVVLVQEAGYDRQVAAGIDPVVGISQWVLDAYTPVREGHVAASFDIRAWPQGDAVAWLYFWLDDTQPPTTIARYGHDGSGLRGPDVVHLADRGNTLQVSSRFSVP